MIDQRNEGRTGDQPPEWAIGAEQAELDEEGDERDHACEQDAAGPGIRRGFRVRNHEEGKDKQCAAFDLMQRDGERIAQPQCPCDQQADIEAEERQRHIRPRCTGDDEASQADNQKPEPGDLAPLPR